MSARKAVVRRIHASFRYQNSAHISSETLETRPLLDPSQNITTDFVDNEAKNKGALRWSMIGTGKKREEETKQRVVSHDTDD